MHILAPRNQMKYNCATFCWGRSWRYILELKRQCSKAGELSANEYRSHAGTG